MEALLRRVAERASRSGVLDEGDPAQARRLQALEERALSWSDDLRGFLRDLMLRNELDDIDVRANYVNLMTLHASKGLEFVAVFIPGCEEGIVPYRLFRDHYDAAEERRLFYVGMTRAKHYLLLSHARRRRLFGRTMELARSPFLDAIADELMDQQVHSSRRPAGPSQLELFD